ncbi:hypothetical protein [Novosphingobium album (ex Hu et al. 2023)]|uniref:Poly(3-hydroxyalkanoate) polymerase subunit PhaE n=1 Tax=Novosphingobium album (ex Hu et al. 2023) TaxID=2930093 RepID=A0ABT0AW16_9SPHN|nr:hypothetical protein [Novosphingobium album (ex Hu et al. 2023)]MCJ2176957.1 hypothetical protein [Novosphingobium album (ex Hu et al. 2023)]
MTISAFDPIAAWQKMIQDWEAEINAWSGRLTESEQFSAVLGQTSKMIVVAQKAMTEQLEGLLQSLNLPSKTQVEALADRLDSIEDSIAQLRIALDKLANDGTPTPVKTEPRRTRVPANKARKD